MVPASSTTEAQSLKILVVDDSATIRENVRYHLEAAGYEVALCDNPVEVPFKLWRCAPDVLVLDVDMPGIPGPRVAEIALGGENTRHITVLFYSSQPEEELVALVERVGAHGYLHKSHSPTELAELIRAVTTTRSRP